MIKLFKLLMQLYPRTYRDEFGEEMRSVFLELVNASRSDSRTAAGWFASKEILGLLYGAGREHLQQLTERTAALRETMAHLLAGMALAFAIQVLLYRSLVPI